MAVPLWISILIGLVLISLVTSAFGWTAYTPAGIKIMADEATIIQYNHLWNPRMQLSAPVHKPWSEFPYPALTVETPKGPRTTYTWEDIEWQRLDELFDDYEAYYISQGWDLRNAFPYLLTIVIQPWNEQCSSRTSRRIYADVSGWGWICCQGWYHPPSNTANFHLGTDPGVDTENYYAFQQSAFPDELKHFFQNMAGRPIGNYFKQEERGFYRIVLP